eukprot:512130_1
MFLSLALLFSVAKAGTPCTVATETTACSNGYVCDESTSGSGYCFGYCNMEVGCQDGSPGYYCTSSDKIYGYCEEDTDECTAETDNCVSGVCLIAEGRRSGTCAECTEEDQTACTDPSICIIQSGALGGFCSECTDSDTSSCGEFGACIFPGPGKTSGLCGCKRENCCDERSITLSNNFDDKYNNECKLCMCNSDGISCYMSYEYQTNEWKKGYIDTVCGEIACEFDDYVYDDVVADDTASCCPRCVRVDCSTDGVTCDRGYECNSDTGLCYTTCSDATDCVDGYGCMWGKCKAYECTKTNAVSNCELTGICGIIDSSDNGYCCEKEAEIYRINGQTEGTYQCKIHYCKQDGGNQYVKDDIYSDTTATNGAELLTYLKKACPDIATCDRANLKFPTVTQTNDYCCPICKDCGTAGTCSEGQECVDDVCVTACDDDETRNSESGVCECSETNKESVNGVCVSLCSDTQSRDADGNCAIVCTENGNECDTNKEEGCINDGNDVYICQVICSTDGGDGIDNDCDGIAECVNGVCRQQCGDNETRNNDGNCVCGENGTVCDDDQKCEDGICIETKVKDDKGGGVNHTIFMVVGFVFVILTWL